MARFKFLRCVVFYRGMVRKCGPSLMRIKVEEFGGLGANKVVRRGGTAANDNSK